MRLREDGQAINRLLRPSGAGRGDDEQRVTVMDSFGIVEQRNQVTGFGQLTVGDLVGEGVESQIPTSQRDTRDLG